MRDHTTMPDLMTTAEVQDAETVQDPGKLREIMIVLIGVKKYDIAVKNEEMKGI